MFQRTSSSYQLASKISKSSQTNKYQQLRVKIMTLMRKNIVIIQDDVNCRNTKLNKIMNIEEDTTI